MFDFSGQVALVTGGSGNLGRAVVQAFLSAGAKVAAVDYSKAPVNLFPETVDSQNLLFIDSLDVTDPAAVAQMVEKVLQAFGRIDVLVNTVGGYRAGTPVHATPLDAWDFMMNLNARSVFITSQAVIPVMLRQGRGKIINIAASSALKGSANSAAYGASKSAVARLTESMAEEYKLLGINVNAIIPSIIDTPQNRQAMPNADFNLWVKPNEIARVILFLASEDASPIQGALIPVYGKK